MQSLLIKINVYTQKMNHTSYTNTTTPALYSYYISWVSILLWTLVSIVVVSLLITCIYYCIKRLRYKRNNNKLIQTSKVTTNIKQKQPEQEKLYNSRTDTPQLSNNNKQQPPTSTNPFELDDTETSDITIEFDSTKRVYNYKGDPEIVPLDDAGVDETKNKADSI